MKTPTIPAAGTLLAVALNPALAIAETPHHGGDELPAITVTADPFDRRHPIEATQASAVLAQDSLERARAATLGETLANQAGVHNADFASGSGRPVIRGQSGPRVRILNGGSAVADASTLSPDHNVAVEPFRARQIEVLKGPASLLYGSGAIGGVVNVVSDLIPRDALAQPELGLGASFDSVNQAQTYWAHGESQLGPFAVHLDALDRKTKDYEIPGHAENDEHQEESAYGKVENSSLENQSIGVGLGLVSQDDQWLGLGLTHYRSNYGAPGHAHEEEEPAAVAMEEKHAEHGTRIDLEQTRVELRGQKEFDSAFLRQLRGSLIHSQYEHQELEADEAGTLFENDAQELRLELTHAPIGNWRGVAGLHVSQQDFAALGDEAVVPPVRSQSYALFTVQERELGVARVSFGTRLEHLEHDPQNANRGAYNLLNGSTALHYDAAENQHLRLGLSYSQRAPDVQELYSDGAHLATRSFDIGSGDLDKETALNFDAGWHADWGAFSLNLDVFYTQYHDFIFNAEVDLDGDGLADTAEAHGEETEHADDAAGEDHADEELLILQYQQANARFWGGELELGYRFNQTAQLRLFTDLVRATRQGGQTLPRTPASRVGLALDAKHRAWRYGLSLIQVLDQNRTAALETATKGYTLLSADLAYSLALDAHELRVRLRGRNLLDEQARNHVSVLKDLAPLPGRNLGISLEYDF